jgi:hypothetical protein
MLAGSLHTIGITKGPLSTPLPVPASALGIGGPFSAGSGAAAGGGHHGGQHHDALTPGKASTEVGAQAWSELRLTAACALAHLLRQSTAVAAPSIDGPVQSPLARLVLQLASTTKGPIKGGATGTKGAGDGSNIGGGAAAVACFTAGINRLCYQWTVLLIDCAINRLYSHVLYGRPGELNWAHSEQQPLASSVHQHCQRHILPPPPRRRIR